VGFALAEETPSLWIDVPFVAQVKNGLRFGSDGDGDGVLGEKDRAHAQGSADAANPGNALFARGRGNSGERDETVF